MPHRPLALPPLTTADALMAFSQDAEWEDEPSEAFAAAFEALEGLRGGGGT